MFLSNFKEKTKQRHGVFQVSAEVDDVFRKIRKYMTIVRKTARDMVPKAIKLYIIDDLKDFIHTELAPSLLDPSENLVSSTIEYQQIKEALN